MKYSIQINSSPYQSNSSETAYQFIKSALEMGHEVIRVFFYQEGVYHAFRYVTPPDDEVQIVARWSALARRYKLDLVVCISAAQRRGLLEANEAKRQGKVDNDVADGFRIAGLGQWVEATLKADRFIEFN
ncbi:tRNA 2-thiouridine synthesizing protein D [Bathymodiolus platifrons methanotrophic gill symbiont]|uniref:sulfurtransferase complex subunit TusD n=1 Tax=Bathymodiolus platifrons methanotrophic gill symbiont TaxID=113268 RepID=UPI000B40C5D0|nr:sulfurtransferase complex subunit TusD [Bathymodiolus platifrons methanotrophic gill symbiont]MCK5869904.1 sulfurtransferase complex subunit TusD [Methyloprofundus sp.]TXK94815.1 sulfurtransferase complex subunit TusD [Methylococcaceae bacterium CS4]TXL01346.1 sulfurtransferase complex subunit TusD [Methylococcaceae bacterium CS5]TXL01940.1 sulfurtransferase complex subunit TusD [Methylococcaceae bacterium HT1]TXL03022.1 sulfurtransferase complex subunit TusD [Methylococcaceae bacterium CS3